MHDGDFSFDALMRRKTIWTVEHRQQRRAVVMLLLAVMYLAGQVVAAYLHLWGFTFPF